jgi:hypothetical protein
MPPKTKRLQAKDFVPKEMQNYKSLIKKTSFFDFRIIDNNKGKLACVVKVKTFNKAVLRNKLRRKVYSVLYTVFKEVPYSVIAYPTKQALTTKQTDLIKEAEIIKEQIKL